MATCYLARQHSLGRDVVLKVLKPNLAEDPIATERFLREAQIAAKLHHAHIVAIHDVGVHEGRPYIAMANEPGGSVADSPKLVGDPKAVLQVVRDIAEALDYAHRQGVVHRDVKPENILRREDGVSVLSDFGIARAREGQPSLTQEGTSLGTPNYMSPEQLQGHPLDGRSDLYSLGVSMYQLLTGKLPFQGTDGWSIGMQHLTAPVPRLEERFGHLQGLLDALMAKDPEHRPATGRDVVERVEALLKYTASGSGPTAQLPNHSPIASVTSVDQPQTPTLFAILRNPASAADRLAADTPFVLRPWPLVVLVGSVWVFLDWLMPLPATSLAGQLNIEAFPPVAEAYQHEALALDDVRRRVALFEALIYPIFMAALVLVSAAGLRIADGSRRYANFVAILLYATAAASIVSMGLHVLVYLIAPGFRYFILISGLLVYAYYIYAVCWTYRKSMAMTLIQVMMFLAANSFAQLLISPIAVLALVVMVRVSFGAVMNPGGNVDVFISDLGITPERVALRRPDNLTRTIGISGRPVFVGDDGDLLVSVAPGAMRAELKRWNHGSAELTSVLPEHEHSDIAGWPLADGSLIVLRQEALWKVSEGAEPRRLTPAGESIKEFAVSPAGQVFAISGEERRGFLLDVEAAEIRLVQGAVKLGAQAQWHSFFRCFTALQDRQPHQTTRALHERWSEQPSDSRADESEKELVCIDPLAGNLTLLARLPSHASGAHAWIDPQRLLWPDNAELVVLDIKSGLEQRIDLSGDRIAGIGRLSVSPDGRMLAFERNRKVGWGEWLKLAAHPLDRIDGRRVDAPEPAKN